MSTETTRFLLARYTERGWEGEKNRKWGKEKRRSADIKPREKKKLRGHHGTRPALERTERRVLRLEAKMRRSHEQTEETSEKREKGRGFRR